MQLSVLVERVDTNVHFLVLGLIFSLQMDTEVAAFFILSQEQGLNFHLLEFLSLNHYVMPEI